MTSRYTSRRQDGKSDLAMRDATLTDERPNTLDSHPPVEALEQPLDVLEGAENQRRKAVLMQALFGLEPASEDMVPQKLGRFIVIELLGMGGMGAVYSAYDPTLDRRVALKLLLPARVGQTAPDAIAARGAGTGSSVTSQRRGGP